MNHRTDIFNVPDFDAVYCIVKENKCLCDVAIDNKEYNFLFITLGKGPCYLALIGLCLYHLYIVVILIEIINSVGIHFMLVITF
jgi:hypothetical protein